MKINSIESYKKALAVLRNKPDGATHYWPYRDVYAKDTHSFSIGCMWGIETTTTTPFFQDGAWDTYSSSGYPNTVELKSIERQAFLYRTEVGLYEKNDAVMYRKHLTNLPKGAFLVKSVHETYVMASNGDELIKMPLVYIVHADKEALASTFKGLLRNRLKSLNNKNVSN